MSVKLVWGFVLKNRWRECGGSISDMLPLELIKVSRQYHEGREDDVIWVGIRCLEV